MAGSHIVIPKAILKHFVDDQNKLYYYDLQSKTIKQGGAGTLNTQIGYYSQAIEQQLSATIETPIGKVIQVLEKGYRDLLVTKKMEMVIRAKSVQIIKNYVYALLTRSPQMARQVSENMIFRWLYSEQNFHDISFANGYRVAKEEAFLDAFQLTFIFCGANDEYILPMIGFCSFLYDNTEIIVVPLTKKIAAYFYKGKAFCQRIYVGAAEHIKKVNEVSVEQQLKSGQGFIASSNRELLDNLIGGEKNAQDEK